MSQHRYEAKYHPGFFDTLETATEGMTEEQFTLFFELFKHEINNLSKNPYGLSRDCKYGILKDEGFRTMSLHSRLPKDGTGDLRIIFKIDDDAKINFYFAIGKRINDRPRPANDIYSVAEEMLKRERKNS